MDTNGEPMLSASIATTALDDQTLASLEETDVAFDRLEMTVAARECALSASFEAAFPDRTVTTDLAIGEHLLTETRDLEIIERIRSLRSRVIALAESVGL